MVVDVSLLFSYPLEKRYQAQNTVIKTNSGGRNINLQQNMVCTYVIN